MKKKKKSKNVIQKNWTSKIKKDTKYLKVKQEEIKSKKI